MPKQSGKVSGEGAVRTIRVQLTRKQQTNSYKFRLKCFSFESSLIDRPSYDLGLQSLLNDLGQQLLRQFSKENLHIAFYQNTLIKNGIISSASTDKNKDGKEQVQV